MVIVCDDLIYNDFRMSDYDIVCSNGSEGLIDETEDMSLTPSFTTVFTGERLNNTYISQKYSDQTAVSVRFMRKECSYQPDYFTENELRTFNRMLTGKRGFSWLKIVNDSNMETDFYYKAMVSKIEYQRLGTKVIGYDVTFTCDGGQAYSEEQSVYISARANTPFYVFNNSDDLHNYLYPTITVMTSTEGTLILTNTTDNRTTTIEDMSAGEQLVIDSQNELLTSSKSRPYILNSFPDLHWPRLLPDKNEFTCNMDCTIQFTFRAIRKVGIVS